MKKYDYYLAAPFFNDIERTKVLAVASALREIGHTVYVPMEHKIENAWSISNQEWGRRVFENDVKAINNSSKVIAIITTANWIEDGGTAWEIGYAYGKGIPVIGIDMCDNNLNVASLMILNSLDNAINFNHVRQK